MSENEEEEHETESKVLEINESCSGADYENGSEDEPIWPARSKRRRRSYIPPARILEVFPDVTPETLCELSELKSFTPTKILSHVPSATVGQIAEMCRVVEELQAPAKFKTEPEKIRTGSPLDLLAELKKIKSRW